jgi:hypothetical protein
MFNNIIIKAPIVKYKPILVNDIFKLPNIDAFKDNKSLTSNWSKGLAITANLPISIKGNNN